MVWARDYPPPLEIVILQLTGFYLLGGAGGKIPPQTLHLPPQKFLPIKYNVLAKNLSVISQLLGPQNCLRMPQNHSQKAQNSKKIPGGGHAPRPPLKNCGLWLQPPFTITFNIFPPPKKILDRTLADDIGPPPPTHTRTLPGTFLN